MLAHYQSHSYSISPIIILFVSNLQFELKFEPESEADATAHFYSYQSSFGITLATTEHFYHNHKNNSINSEQQL